MRGGIFGPKLEAQRHALELPVVELPAGRVALAHVCLDADGLGAQGDGDGGELAVQFCALVVARLGGYANGDEDGLDVGNARRDHEALVVGVHEHHDADGAGRQAPGVLPDVDRGLLLAFLAAGVFDGDVEHLAKVLAQAVAGGGLDTASGGGDEAFNCGGVVCAGKLLFDRLLALDHRHGKELLVDVCVIV